MKLLAQAAEAIANTTRKLEKTAILAAYLNSRNVDEAAQSAMFLSGQPFPQWDSATLNVGGRSLWRMVAELSGKNEGELTEAYRRLGDLGDVAGDVIAKASIPATHVLNVLDVATFFRRIATARGTAAKTALTKEMLEQASPLEAKYIVKIMTAELRIGLKESLVEEGIARAFGATLAEVQRANMLLGDIGETLRLAAAHRLDDARMRLFHPLGFMLASPVGSAEESLSYFADPAVEDKYDGIRAQAHIADGEARLFSRTRDDVSEAFPELVDTLAGVRQAAILDGEILAWDFAAGRARPFSVLQQRLGRRSVSARMLEEVQVAFLAFDILYFNAEILIERPLRERALVLDEVFRSISTAQGSKIAKRRTGQQQLAFPEDGGLSSGPARVFRAPVSRAKSTDEIEGLFRTARDRGNEGLMIKDLESAYTPGKRGKSWLKMKRELATLDVVVTAVEYGHGKRIGVLSDYTFAVRHGDRLLNIGKAYSGLTDAEIAQMTAWFLEHTIEDQGFRRIVEPRIVLEVAFNNMMTSDRHESGYALRFPRIVRLRPDKPANEANTLDDVREIFEGQFAKP